MNKKYEYGLNEQEQGELHKQYKEDTGNTPYTIIDGETFWHDEYVNYLEDMFVSTFVELTRYEEKYGMD